MELFNILVQDFLYCLFFPLICLHINAPNLPGHRNIFLLLHLKTQRILLCFGNQVLTSAGCQFCCGISCSAVRSCRLWSACAHLDKAVVEHLLNISFNMSFYNCISVSSFPHSPFSQSLSHSSSVLPHPASFLSWCVSVTLESKTWVPSKECVFLCALFEQPSTPLCVIVRHSFTAFLS